MRRGDKKIMRVIAGVTVTLYLMIFAACQAGIRGSEKSKEETTSQTQGITIRTHVVDPRTTE